MSGYWKSWRKQRYDLASMQRTRAAPAEPAGCGEIDGIERRRAEPCRRLLPIAVDWAKSLPADSVPLRLILDYPRIVNRIAAAWDELPDCRLVFDDLLVDRRGGRTGFSLHIQLELERLRDIRMGSVDDPFVGHSYLV